MIDCDFRLNAADEGGAVLFEDGNGFGEISGCLFEKNYAVDSGGALKLRSIEVDNATIFNTTFKKNKAGSETMPNGVP